MKQYMKLDAEIIYLLFNMKQYIKQKLTRRGNYIFNKNLLDAEIIYLLFNIK